MVHSLQEIRLVVEVVNNQSQTKQKIAQIQEEKWTRLCYGLSFIIGREENEGFSVVSSFSFLSFFSIVSIFSLLIFLDNLINS